jgi:hypothetical protein
VPEGEEGAVDDPLKTGYVFPIIALAILWVGGWAGCAGPAAPMATTPPPQVSETPAVEPTQRMSQVTATFTAEPTPLPPEPEVTATFTAEPAPAETCLPGPPPTASALADPSEYSIQLGLRGDAGEGCYDFGLKRHLKAGAALDDCDVALGVEGGEPVLVAYSGVMMDQQPRILDVGPADLQPTGPAPASGYRHKEKAIEGHVYWLQTRGDGLIRFRVEKLSEDQSGNPGLEIRYLVVKKELNPCCGFCIHAD